MGELINNEKALKAKKDFGKNYRKEKRYEKRKNLSLPKYSLGEEIFSAIVHGAAALSAIAAYVILLVFCKKEAVTLFTVHFYGISMIVLYAVSTIYHALGINRAKKVFRILDHCNIFVLIAGTYAPVSLVSVGGTVGWSMFLVVSAAALLGITLNAVNLKKFAKISVLCYIVMGWTVAFVIETVYLCLGTFAFTFLLAGGVLYTVGALVYLFGKKIPYMHSIWHFFTFIASICHFFCVLDVVTK
ncbi:MAG: hemolysin III family protein [Ruminococcaceae bacterium]|nr:hemolysin III family protein [Oscillospiraceae bacterium]